VTISLPDWMTATGPVDFYDPEHPVVQDLLAADGIVVDANGAHHGRGGRFIPKQLEYAHLVEAHVVEDTPAPGTRITVHAPRCPHGHFSRWALRNCVPCREPLQVQSVRTDSPTGAQQCTGTKDDGDRCTRRTPRRFRGRPACHQHGGTPTS